MKKTILLAAAFGLIAAGTVQAVDSTTGSNIAGAGTGITGSKHDLSSATGLDAFYNGDDPLDRVCIWCHAPHHTMTTNESAGILYLPLWNHEVTSKEYVMYESDFGEGPDPSGMDVGDGGAEQFADRHLLNSHDDLQSNQPGGVSRLCLSCHDGTVAVNEYGRAPQRGYSVNSSTDEFITNHKDSGSAGQFLIGGNPYGLLNHHPIGFNYQNVVDHDDEIADTSTAIAGASTGMTTIGSLLYDGKMECVTCHDVHNSKNTGETFLWVTDRQSGFCLTCHIK